MGAKDYYKQKRITPIQQTLIDKKARLSNKPAHLQYKIGGLQKEWVRCAQSLELESLLKFKIVEDLLKSYARMYASRWCSFRLDRSDFISVFYEVAWREICRYSWTSDFYLYETLELAIQRRGGDLVRQMTKTDKHRSLHTALPLMDGFEAFYPDSWNLENEVMDNICLDDLLVDSRQLDQDVAVLLLEGNSQRTIAKILGKDRGTISNAVNRIKIQLKVS